MTSVMTGAEAVAHAARLARPSVVAAYPITPQSHITERISKFAADGEMDCEYVSVESEFSAISCVTGASATGVRTFTATSSQGIALMHEVLFATSGMRLPVVMPVANRALSAPINIWNDWQDSISERDNGWIQLFTETNQEALDTTLQAYKIAENENVLLPVIVNLDGFYLTHTVDRVELPDQKKVYSYLGTYQPKHAYLDPKRPVTQGPFAYPEVYYKLRRQQNRAMNGSKPHIGQADRDFKKQFGRGYGLVEKTSDSPTLVVTMGSLAGNVRVATESNDCGLLKIRLYRPLPKEEILEACEGVEKLVIIEKDIAMGLGSGVLYSELRDLFSGVKDRPSIHGWVTGLGGVDVPVTGIEYMLKNSNKQKSEWYP